MASNTGNDIIREEYTEAAVMNSVGTTREPQRILNDLARPFPNMAVKQRKGRGATTLDYLEGHTVIHRLNEATDGNWQWEILELSEFTTVGRDGKEEQVLRCHGRLTIPPFGPREHIGVQGMSNASMGGEDIVKGAVTDALKKAATLYGMGLELYGDNYEHISAKNQLARYVGLQPLMKEEMSAWIRERLNGETIDEQTTGSIKRITAELMAVFPRISDEEAAARK